LQVIVIVVLYYRYENSSFHGRESHAPEDGAHSHVGVQRAFPGLK